MSGTHPPGVVQNFGVRPTVVGGVSVGVVAQSGQHGGDDGHVPHHISWNLPHPFGQGLHVDGLDDLVSGPLHPGDQTKVSHDQSLTSAVKNRTKMDLTHLGVLQLLRPHRSLNMPDLRPLIRLLQLSLYSARSATPPWGMGREAHQGTPGVGVKQTNGERGPSGWMEAMALTKRLERFHRS